MEEQNLEKVIMDEIEKSSLSDEGKAKLVEQLKKDLITQVPSSFNSKPKEEEVKAAGALNTSYSVFNNNIRTNGRFEGSAFSAEESPFKK